MRSVDPATRAFYQARAPHYTFTSAQAHSRPLDAFLDRLPAGARVLELGCGGGQDAARIKARGFMVDATDAVPAMVVKANERFGVGARVMAFGELDAHEAYHAVWAHASLLHCPRAVLPDVLARIACALVPSGLHFASYKLGDGEGRDALGRLHNFPSPEWLRAAYEAAGFIPVAEDIYSAGSTEGLQREWIDLTMRTP